MSLLSSVLPRGRAKLPLSIRRKVQAFVRYFAVAAICWVTVWHMYRTVLDFRLFGDVTKLYGFGATRRL
jgi:hypothetical protein